MTRGLVLLVCLSACSAPTLTIEQRRDLYQANVIGAQAACTAMLLDKEVPHTPAIDQWCRLVLAGTDECPKAGP